MVSDDNVNVFKVFIYLIIEMKCIEITVFGTSHFHYINCVNGPCMIVFYNYD